MNGKDYSGMKWVDLVQALADWMARWRDDDVTERLDRVYAEESSSLDLVVEELQGFSVGRDDHRP